MDPVKAVTFFISIAVAFPVCFLSVRCVTVLRKERYWRNPFCKIFIVTMFLNIITNATMVVHLYMPGLGWLGDYCIKIGFYITLAIKLFDLLVNIYMFSKLWKI
ncbi:hypothetical protein PFISCL1PPCAC_13582 [Pristionchus fissidentatus]|uniref:Serpentine receptor class gamma n=1 Tax=Pristionchus fissidentatus TaxID=1538716 RepID=A0AAV5VUS1_9BILA|nr:hypothetical protein PFISCL1PPCAC_13582 [Pristionchus fissidentatus]